MIKRLFVIILAAALALSLAACENVENPESPESGSNPPAISESTENGGDTQPEGEETPEPEAPPAEVTVESIRNGNYIGDLLYNAGTVSLTYTALDSDGSVHGTNNIEFYYLDSGCPAIQNAFSSDEVGSAETMVLAGDGFAASFDIYTGFSKGITVIPTQYYEAQIEANWDMLYPEETYETITAVSEQDGATVVETFNYNEEYGEDYKRALYYLDGDGRIIYKEVTRYLVTEGAEIDPALPYGTDEAPVMSVDTYSVQYGAERVLNLTTDRELTEGDTCELTVHIIDGDYTETQTLNVAKDASVTVMDRWSVYETFTDEKMEMDDIFDMSGLSEDSLEIWARNPRTAEE